MNHTPAPWIAYVSESGSFAVDATHNGSACAIASRGEWESNRAASAANARLIAAAPDLLAALTEYVAAADNSMNTDDDVTAMLRFADADKAARAAITKATTP